MLPPLRSAAVPGPPVGILFPEVRTTSVRLIWQPPAAPNGIILGKRPNLSPAGASSVLPPAPGLWTRGSLFAGAQHLAQYRLKALLSTLHRTCCEHEHGLGQEGPTQGGVPQLALGVRAARSPPTALTPLSTAYQITHRLNTTNANTATVEVLNPSARQYTATGLRPESTYLFRITAQTRKGWGEAAEALVVTTEKRGERPGLGWGLGSRLGLGRS